MATIPGTPKITTVRTVNALIETSHPLSLLNTFIKNKTAIARATLNITTILLANISLKLDFLPIYIKKSSEQRPVIYQVKPSTFQ
jgi:hypothetical protein